MQYIHTKGIILQKTQISDFKYILRLYSEKNGLISAEVGINNFIQPAYLQIPNICDVLILQNKNKKFSIKEIKPIYIYQNLHIDFKKNIIVQFVAEVLIKTIKEDMLDEKTFHFIYQTLINLDKSDANNIHLFHLCFLKEYIKISGHQPLNNYDNVNRYFSMPEGRFVKNFNPNNTLNQEDSELIQKFLFSEDVQGIENFPVFRITHCLIDYMKFHFSIPDIQALPFLKDLFIESEI